MAIVFAQIEIVASPAMVRSLLTDWAGYPSWNPLLRRIEPIATDTLLMVSFHPSGLWPIAVRVEALHLERPERLLFTGRWLHPALLSYHHQIEIEAEEGYCVLRQTLRLTGLLQKIFPDFMMHPVRSGLCRMNEAARDRLERLRFSNAR